jgi:hypothetical protein
MHLYEKVARWTLSDQDCSNFASSIVEQSHTLGCQRRRQLQQLVNLRWREETFHSAAAENRQRRLIKIRFHQLLVLQKDLLHRAQEANLVRIIVMGGNEPLEGTPRYLAVIGQRASVGKINEPRPRSVPCLPSTPNGWADPGRASDRSRAGRRG